MATCLLYRQARLHPPRFYRIELALNLFTGISVLREWGKQAAAGEA